MEVVEKGLVYIEGVKHTSSNPLSMLSYSLHGNILRINTNCYGEILLQNTDRYFVLFTSP